MNNNILITGGVGNLGATVVKTLLHKGYNLHLPVRETKLDSTATLHYYTTDLTNETASAHTVEQIFEKSKGINTAVFLAGGFDSGGLHDMNMERLNKMIQLNFATAFNMAKCLVNKYKTTGGGKLIFIGAKAAMDNNSATQTMAYSLSKQMLFSFCNMINETEKEAHITAHILLPNALDTKLNREQMPNADFSKLTSTQSIANTIANIIDGTETKNVIEF